MTDESTLLSDQVFQLNTFLWALEDLPTEPVEEETRPVLRQAGYYLGAIGRRVIMPSDEVTRAVLTKLTGAVNRAPCHPDLWQTAAFPQGSCVSFREAILSDASGAESFGGRR